MLGPTDKYFSVWELLHSREFIYHKIIKRRIAKLKHPQQIKLTGMYIRKNIYKAKQGWHVFIYCMLYVYVYCILYMYIVYVYYYMWGGMIVFLFSVCVRPAKMHAY